MVPGDGPAEGVPQPASVGSAPAAAAAAAAPASSRLRGGAVEDLLGRLQRALTTSREESVAFGHSLMDWLQKQAPGAAPIPADLQEAPPLSARRSQMYTASRFGDMAGVSPYGLPRSFWEVMTGRCKKE